MKSAFLFIKLRSNNSFFFNYNIFLLLLQSITNSPLSLSVSFFTYERQSTMASRTQMIYTEYFKQRIATLFSSYAYPSCFINNKQANKILCVQCMHIYQAVVNRAHTCFTNASNEYNTCACAYQPVSQSDGSVGTRPSKSWQLAT